jgi:hypothetical protein
MLTNIEIERSTLNTKYYIIFLNKKNYTLSRNENKEKFRHSSDHLSFKQTAPCYFNYIENNLIQHILDTRRKAIIRLQAFCRSKFIINFSDYDKKTFQNIFLV